MSATSKPDPASSVPSQDLRDLFAAHALSALISSPKLAGVPRADVDGMARQAFDYANAMMKARQP